MTGDASEPQLRVVPATVHGRMLVRPPGDGAVRRWLVGFHGYAQNAEVFMDTLARVPHSQAWLVVSVQALHPFYNSRTNEVVANWMTRQDREHAIADNIAYVDAVLADLERAFGVPESLVFAGFSQGVAMAYRAALRGSRPADAIVAVGGDVPPELAAAGGRAWPTVWIGAGDRDAYYTREVLARDLEILRANGADVRSTVFACGHEWSDEIRDAAGALLVEVAARRL